MRARLISPRITNACTTDACNPATGCTHAPTSCDDATACTADACNPAFRAAYTPAAPAPSSSA
ncbi:MAG: hypothetical protein R3F39_09130 [Myxococcota bacterium]